MRKKILFIFLLVLVSSLNGCATAKTSSQKEVDKLKSDLQRDPEVRSAVESIAGTLSGEQPTAKYCPSTGKRYAPHLETVLDCPEKLVPLNE